MRQVLDPPGGTDREAVRRAGGHPATPHVFRHQCITLLTKTSGMADAELQLITGHARRETLAIYQHVAVDGQLADQYQQAMKDVGLSDHAAWLPGCWILGRGDQLGCIPGGRLSRLSPFGW